MVETSVIIPTYNRLSFLREAVESVLAQSYQFFELIIVDDGSADATADFVGKLAGNVKYLFQSNQGPSAARNCGIEAAKGRFITFLDSDDLWHPNKLGIQVEFMNAHQEAMVCYTDEIWIRRGVRVNPRQKHRKHSGWIFEHCLPLCIVSPSSVLMRREFFETVGLFDEALPSCEDYDLWLRASLRFPFHFIETKLITKRGGHADQLSAQRGLDVYRVQALQKLFEEDLLTSRQKEWVRLKIREKCQILEQGFLKRGKRSAAQRFRDTRIALNDG